MYVSQSVRKEQLAPHSTKFREILYRGSLLRPVAALTLNKLTQYWHEDLPTRMTVPVLRRDRKTVKTNYQLRHVWLSVHMKQLGSHWTDFHEI